MTIVGSRFRIFAHFNISISFNFLYGYITRNIALNFNVLEGQRKTNLGIFFSSESDSKTMRAGIKNKAANLVSSIDTSAHDFGLKKGRKEFRRSKRRK